MKVPQKPIIKLRILVRGFCLLNMPCDACDVALLWANDVIVKDSGLMLPIEGSICKNL